MNPPYVIDSSSFRVLSNYYEARFPTFWNLFEKECNSGRVISVREVLEELKEYNQNWIWQKARLLSHIFLSPTEPETSFVANLMAQKRYQALISRANILQGKPVADPFLIAAAHHHSGTVVTGEKWKPNASKVPNVCHDYGIDSTNVEGLLATFGWTF
jgi:hypothetical protein